jgi:hypothetical protein
MPSSADENTALHTVPGSLFHVFVHLLMTQQEQLHEQVVPLVSSEKQDNHRQQNETMAGPPITDAKKNKLVAAFIAFSAILGYFAATLPTGAGWRFFSWHPFLMTTGFIGMMGSSAIIKKRGGYANTKLHGILSSTGLMMAFGGLYVIYKNKENMGKEHITSIHALAGIITIAAAVLPAIAGVVLLHPDFGIDKTNKTYRFAHKWSARIVMLSAWVTAVFGLMKMTSDIKILAAFAVPLVVLAPMTFV